MNSLIAIKNPATGEPLGSVPNQSETDVNAVVSQAKLASPAWKALLFKERAQFILKARDLILAEIDPLAKLISQENGKPLMEAVSHDIMPVMDLMTFFAKRCEKLLRKESIQLGKWNFLGHQSYLEYEPYGVVGIISPWNFPFSTPLSGVVMALLVGNTVVLKPSEYTPLIAVKMREIFERAGLPPNVLQVVTGDGLTGAALVKSGVNKICFTGSVPTGKKIMAMAAENLTPVCLELGGKDPLLVLQDADMDLASSAAVWGAFCNSGQVCASVERVYVHESQAEDFTRQVVEKTQKLRQGLGMDPDVDVGSMTAEVQIQKVEAQLDEVRARGGKILTGGKRRADSKGYFMEPTVIAGVDASFSAVKDETFGPVLPILTYQTEEEAIRLANDSPYALNAYIWTRDIAHGKRLASQIEAGTVNVNESVFSYALPQTPWGGPKESGIGRTHGAMGLLDLVQMRHVHVNYLASKKSNFWWYSYSQQKLDMMKSLCVVLFGKGLKRIPAMLRLVKGMITSKTL